MRPGRRGYSRGVLCTVAELARFLEREAGLRDPRLPDPEAAIEGFSPLSETREGTLTWSRSPDLDFSTLRAAAVIAPAEAAPTGAGEVAVLPVEEPRLAFALALREYGARPRPSGTEPTAAIGEGCEIGDGAYVGHHAVVGDGVAIGPRTLISDQVSIRSGTRIGADCTIHPGVVIGTDGFGYERGSDGEWVKLEHLGGVAIGDDVEIGANTCIDRGVLGDTVIRDGAKIDNLCHIAHNVEVGERAMVIALSMIGGSAKLGEESWIAPAATVKNGIEIGPRSLLGLGAVVLEDVAADEVVAGVPARPIRKRG